MGRDLLRVLWGKERGDLVWIRSRPCLHEVKLLEDKGSLLKNTNLTSLFTHGINLDYQVLLQE